MKHGGSASGAFHAARTFATSAAETLDARLPQLARPQFPRCRPRATLLVHELSVLDFACLLIAPLGAQCVGEQPPRL